MSEERLNELFSIVDDGYSSIQEREIRDYITNLQQKVEQLETQQKEFIEYMNKTIEELECDDVDDEEMKGYLIQRIDTFKEILQKYKSIIGVSDDKTN